MSIPRNLSIIADTLNSDGTFASISNTGSTTLSSGTANGVAYLNGSKVLTTGSAFVFDGTNVGIGTNSPTFPLDVGGPLANIRVAPSTATNNALTRYVNNGGTGYVGLDSSAGGLISAYALNIYHTGAYPIVFSTSGTERMRIDSSGNVGIGTSSPRAKLDVSGSVLAGTYQTATNYAPLSVKTASSITTPSTFTNAINIWNSTTVGEYSNITFGYNSVSLTNAAAYMGFISTSSATFGKGDLVFGTRDVVTDTAASERMRIDSSGNLLVGTTSYVAYATGVGLSKDGAISLGHITGTSSGVAYALFGYNGGGIGSITQSGTTAVLYNTTSDQRLKENIQDAESSSALIDAIKVRQFNWKTDNSHQRYGFVAQELVTVAPEAVHQPVNEEEMMAVDYSKLVPMLVKEIQSLRKRLTALER